MQEANLARFFLDLRRAQLQVPHFEDKDFNLIYVARPPPGVLLETVLSHMISQQLGSPVPLPLDAIFQADPKTLDVWEKTFFLQAKLSSEIYVYAKHLGRVGICHSFFI